MSNNQFNVDGPWALTKYCLLVYSALKQEPEPDAACCFSFEQGT